MCWWNVLTEWTDLPPAAESLDDCITDGDLLKRVAWLQTVAKLELEREERKVKRDNLPTNRENCTAKRANFALPPSLAISRVWFRKSVVLQVNFGWKICSMPDDCFPRSKSVHGGRQLFFSPPGTVSNVVLWMIFLMNSVKTLGYPWNSLKSFYTCITHVPGGLKKLYATVHLLCRLYSWVTPF